MLNENNDRGRAQLGERKEISGANFSIKISEKKYAKKITVKNFRKKTISTRLDDGKLK